MQVQFMLITINMHYILDCLSDKGQIYIFLWLFLLVIGISCIFRCTWTSNSLYKIYVQIQINCGITGLFLHTCSTNVNTYLLPHLFISFMQSNLVIYDSKSDVWIVYWSWPTCSVVGFIVLVQASIKHWGEFANCLIKNRM